AEHLYNAQGYLSQVIEARFSATTTEVHYQVLGMNARGQVTSHRKGGTTETRQYNAGGRCGVRPRQAETTD
ncbi:MAG: hypothetical protein JJT88_20245, partial [Gammaproteobacteria bacterium]|nr:hypothetical protein [Gammaproteobacteria bacterium]